MSDVIVYTLKDVAKLCKVHPITLRGWIKKGMPREKSTKPRIQFEYDIKKIEEWRAVRLAGNQGADIVSLSDKELEVVKSKVEKFKGAIDFYKINRADIFAGKQLAYQKLSDFVISTMTEEEIRAAKLTERVQILKVADVSNAIFYDKERLERGESTQNVSVLITAIKELKSKRSEPKTIEKGE